MGKPQLPLDFSLCLFSLSAASWLHFHMGIQGTIEVSTDRPNIPAFRQLQPLVPRVMMYLAPRKCNTTESLGYVHSRGERSLYLCERLLLFLVRRIVWPAPQRAWLVHMGIQALPPPPPPHHPYPPPPPPNSNKHPRSTSRSHKRHATGYWLEPTCFYGPPSPPRFPLVLHQTGQQLDFVLGGGPKPGLPNSSIRTITAHNTCQCRVGAALGPWRCLLRGRNVAKSFLAGSAAGAETCNTAWEMACAEDIRVKILCQGGGHFNLTSETTMFFWHLWHICNYLRSPRRFVGQLQQRWCPVNLL